MSWFPCFLGTSWGPPGNLVGTSWGPPGSFLGPSWSFILVCITKPERTKLFSSLWLSPQEGRDGDCFIKKILTHLKKCGFSISLSFQLQVWFVFSTFFIKNYRRSETKKRYRGSPLSTVSLSTIPGIVRFKIVLNSTNSQV